MSTPTFRQDLKFLIEYCYEDELRDFKSRCEDLPDDAIDAEIVERAIDADHIFGRIVRLMRHMDFE